MQGLPEYGMGKILTIQEYPLPPRLPEMKSSPDLGLQLECVETNRCVPQGYRLVHYYSALRASGGGLAFRWNAS